MNEAYPHPRTSPFYPNETTEYEYDQKYNGVFLLQGYPNWAPPYYKVGVPLEQPITVHGQSRLFYPYYWTGDGVNYEDAYNNETGVVFTSSDAVAKAVLKGNLMSSDLNGISSNSQRKLVYTNYLIDEYHLVYESMGKVWYAIIENDGDSYEILLKENAKNPSVDYLSDIKTIVFEYWDGSLKLGFLQFDFFSNKIYETSFTISNNYNDLGTLKPVVSCTPNQQFVIYKPSSSSNLKWRSRTNISNLWTWSEERDVPNTDQNTLNWAVASNKLADYNIAFQQGTSTIYYMHADPDGENNLRFCSLTNLSEGTGYTQNLNPSVSYFGGIDPIAMRVMVSWTGFRQMILDKKFAKENEYSMVRYAAVAKVGYGEYWGGWSDFSHGVNFTNNNSIPTSVGSILAFSQSNGQYTKYVKRDASGNYSLIQSLSANGIQPLVSNGTNFSNIKAMVFNNGTTIPYLIHQCTNDFSGGLLEKTGIITENGISYGRTGSLVKNGIEFIFNVGDISVDGSIINFIERIDTLPVNNINELNSAVGTNYFNLNSQSELVFSNYYYTINGNYADSLLDDQFNITFKCELVNALTDEVIGVFDQVTYNKLNTSLYSNPSYLVNCSGIEAGLYYLRLTTSATDTVKMFVGDIQRDDYTLEKSNLIRVGFMGNLVPSAYNLEQNYPNPFNPSTIIKYQIPEDGLVTLKVYDILGREVTTLVNEQKVSGRYEVNFNASHLASGVYIYKLQAGDYNNSKKMLLVK